MVRPPSVIMCISGCRVWSYFGPFMTTPPPPITQRSRDVVCVRWSRGASQLTRTVFPGRTSTGTTSTRRSMCTSTPRSVRCVWIQGDPNYTPPVVWVHGVAGLLHMTHCNRDGRAGVT